jgi:hypothetical protein
MPGALHKHSMLAARVRMRKRQTAQRACDVCTLPGYRQAYSRRNSTERSQNLILRGTGLKADLEVGIVLAPQERDAGEPILRTDGIAGAFPILMRQDARRCGKFRAGDFPANR